MKKLSILILLTLLFFSCKKKETTPKFTWTFKGTTHHANSPYTEIIDNTYYQINADADAFNSILLFTTSFSQGTYYADSTDTLNGAVVGYLKGTDTLAFELTPSGSITISRNEENKISGAFNLITEAGNHIDGSFQDIPY